jgi:TrpR-related protein YerC/YecD
MSVPKTNEKVIYLLKALQMLQTLDDESLSLTFKFLDDLLTDKELIEFANRFYVSGLLLTGKSYVEIEKITGVSSTTIARISKCLVAPNSGYSIVLAEFNKQNPDIFEA